MASNTVMIHKLQQAINNKGEKLLYTISQFYSEQQQRPVNLYQIKKAVYDEAVSRNKSITLFQSTSQIQIVLFLRDYWFDMNGWEVPDDNPIWEKKKTQYKRSKEED